MLYLQRVLITLLVPLVAHVAGLVMAAYLVMLNHCHVVTRQTIVIRVEQVAVIHLHAAKPKR
jgi:hypothetical protein